MALSWNEIKDRAIRFSKEWENETSEDAEAKSFLDGFFDIFGRNRRRIASFETRVKKQGDRDGFIDLLWKGIILIEMKSKGKDLDKAFKQAIEYFPGIKEYDLPKYILVCDFHRFRLYDIEENTQHEFELKDLYKNAKLFGFMAGYQTKTYKPEDPVNIEAALRMGKLHDKLKEIGYDGHALELYLVRILFCLFAEDTTIFDRRTFQDYVDQKTNEDGSDLAAHLAQLFYVLNTPAEKRLKNLDEHLAQFPYVNGKLFEEQLPPASFDSKMRLSLLECCALDWSKISPAIFGSLFQSAMNPVQRRNLGAHYTSETNIFKLIKPLFLDELWQEFEAVKQNRNKLNEFHKKIGQLSFLDPACGCGNFLVITYRELRLLEIEALKLLQRGQQVTEIKQLLRVSIDSFYGIEYEEFPAQITQVAMWLIDHQMNMICMNEFGNYISNLPLQKAATIVQANALQMDWSKLVEENTFDITADVTNIIVQEPKAHYKTLNVYTSKVNEVTKEEMLTSSFTGKANFDYIFGNPPFVGTAQQNANQKRDMEHVFSGAYSFGMLDYVAAWYVKAAQLIQNTKTKVAFVSTNSITQGEQPGVLWSILFNLYKLKIHFAHRSFKWNNEAKGKAAVHVVIIGFANYDANRKFIFEYESVTGEPHSVSVKNINPYLVEGKDIVLKSISKPICNVPLMQSGSAARDGGFLILSDDEKIELVVKNPKAKKYLNRFISGDDFINNVTRWCIWLKGINPADFREIREFQERFKEVKLFREKSTRSGTKKMAELPYLFAEERQPEIDFLLIPKVSGESRKYIPVAYLTKDYIVSDKTFIVPFTSPYHFGIITSLMHMAWMRYTGGRLGESYSYSNTIVYNNYPWPENPTEKQIKAIEAAAQKVLDARVEFPRNSLADLYGALSMPPKLVKAHNELDKAVDVAYRSQPFTTEAKRMEFLFELFEKYTAGLFIKEKLKKTK